MFRPLKLDPLFFYMQPRPGPRIVLPEALIIDPLGLRCRHRHLTNRTIDEGRRHGRQPFNPAALKVKIIMKIKFPSGSGSESAKIIDFLRKITDRTLSRTPGEWGAKNKIENVVKHNQVTPFLHIPHPMTRLTGP